MKKPMFKPVAVILIGMLLIITLAGACGPSAATSSPSSSSGQTIIKMRFADSLSSMNNPLSKLNQEWMKKLESGSGGRIKFSYYSGGTLIDQMQAYDELRSGVADITTVTTPITGAPFIITSSIASFTYGVDLVGARQVFSQLQEKFPEMQKESSAVKWLYGQGRPPNWVHTVNKPIRTLDDFRGLQLQPPVGVIELLAKLGATGSNLPPMEFYNALQKGILDGLFNVIDTLKSMNYADITKYSTNVHMVGPPDSFYAMNLDTWNSLPPDIRKVFEDSIPWVESESDRVMLEQEQETMEWAKGQGHEFIELPQEDLNKFYGILDQLALKKAADLDAQGLPGTKIFQETRRLIDEYNRAK
jgi:TRAP-type transport system periplasmic protein